MRLANFHRAGMRVVAAISKRYHLIALAGAAGIAAFVAAGWWSEPSPVDFNTQVKPILNKKCITCHGGVKRESDFSLLFQKDALAKAKSGLYAIVPGHARESEMIRRLHLSDPSERMPYRKAPLTAEEISILTDWIDQGASWGEHWAYVPVQHPTVPPIPPWGQNAMDGYVDVKLRENGLTSEPQATARTLLRRASLDITGLPPDDQLKKSFLSDTTAYERLVDALLASPHYGERWASMWMDVARYADTKGYERDDSRSIWRYRDWLIRAFNRDMPYDQFITEQLAGDLLANPTDDQYIATAFHRNTLTNDEGGTDNEEFRTAAVLDRVNTTWEGMMGTTFACVQCHSHPYDPFRHEEYYRFMAFFNNTRDEDTEAEYPLLRHFRNEDSTAVHALKDWVEKNISSAKAKEVYTFVKTWQPSINSIRADRFINSELTDTKWLIFRNQAVCRLPAVDLSGSNKLIYRYSSWLNDGTWNVYLDSVGGPMLKSVAVANTKHQWQIVEFTFPQQTGVHDLYFTYVNPNLKKPDDSGMIFDWFYFTDAWDDRNPATKKEFWRLVWLQVETTPVMMENPRSMPRSTHIFERGNWLVKGQAVTPAVPASLAAMPKHAPANRLGLAKWMTDPQHPLVARTMVNRVWEQLFGVGLAETLEDLGTQGIAPTHPELLDYLAWQLVHTYRWSVKKLIREIVTSATYRQASRVTEEKLAKDPLNLYLSRAPRVRLSAEQVRDQALAVTGLLSRKMYGPGVMPYQPKGIWLSPWNGKDWQKSTGEDQYRRGLYTYWKRSAPYPSMMTFDGTSREVCTTRRIRTNTPLQALVTLNDSVYVEAARHLSQQLVHDFPKVEDQLVQAYEQVTGRRITPAKQEVLMALYRKKMPGTAAGNFQKIAQRKPDTDALALVVMALLNLDEVLTKN
jgi:hypothetical protein